MTTALFLKVLLITAMGATAGTLVLGLFALLKEGKRGSKRSNNMMRLRLVFQGIAILIFSLLLFLR